MNPFLLSLAPYCIPAQGSIYCISMQDLSINISIEGSKENFLSINLELIGLNLIHKSKGLVKGISPVNPLLTTDSEI